MGTFKSCSCKYCRHTDAPVERRTRKERAHRKFRRVVRAMLRMGVEPIEAMSTDCML